MISILLPIRNEANFIRQTLDSILAQDYPRAQMEILIADGMSTDGTREILSDYQKTNPQIQVIDNPQQIVPTGLNLAIQCTQGNVLLRIDGHTTIAPDYVTRCVETLHRSGAQNVGGCMTAIGQNRFAQAVAVATSTPFGVGNSRFHYSQHEQWVDSVYMGTWPREVFQQIGLFDEELVRDQDDEFNDRLREHGGKILLNPEIHSEYAVRSNLPTLWKQYVQYGYWKVRVLQKHPRQMSIRQFVPPALVSSLLVTTVLAVAAPWGWIPLAIIAGAYLGSNLVASLSAAANHGWQHLPALPICYSALHLSYGLGFLAGLVKFWNRWDDKEGRVPEIGSTALWN